MSPITVLLLVLAPMLLGFACASSSRSTQYAAEGAVPGIIAGVVFGGLYAWIGLVQLAPTAFVLAIISGIVCGWLPANNPVKKYFNLNRYVR